MKLLDGYTVLAGLFGSEFGPPHFERLENSKALIQQHYDSLFPKWQTVEDLEDILLARITPSNEQLKALAAKSPPPQSWYDEVWEDAPGATPAGP